MSVLTGVLFGTLPAFRTSQIDAFAALKDRDSRPTSIGRRFGVRGSLVAAQMAISIVLLVGAALFVRTLMNLRHLDLGFDREHVLALRLEPRGSNQKRQNGVRLMQLYDGLLGRLRAVPGVRSVSLAGATPLGNENPLMIPVTATPPLICVSAVTPLPSRPSALVPDPNMREPNPRWL